MVFCEWLVGSGGSGFERILFVDGFGIDSVELNDEQLVVMIPCAMKIAALLGVFC